MDEAPRLANQVGERANKRQTRRVDKQEMKDQGWTDVDPKNIGFDLDEYDRVSTSSAFVKTRYTLETLTRIGFFLAFFSAAFIQNVLDGFSDDMWHYAPRRHVPMDVKHVYLYMAVYIRIQGLQDRPTRSHPIPRLLRSHIDDAIRHLKTLVLGVQDVQINSTYVEYFFCHFHVRSPHFEALSTNYQSIFRNIGQFIACDEKVFEFTGWHCFVLKVPAKGATGEMGLWMYQMCCRLSNNKPFMLHCKLKDAIVPLGESNPVLDIVNCWITVVKKFEGQRPNPDCPSVMCIDTYYFSAPVIARLEAVNSIKFLLAATEHKYKLCTYLKDKVQTAGNWAAIFNSTNNRLLTHYFHPQKKLGRKFVLTNALTKKRKRQKSDVVPGCAEYSFLYGICDRFNEFKDFHFPHKHGGFKTCGISGAQHDFVVTSTLKNTFHVFEDVHRSILRLSPPDIPPQQTSWSFREHCLILSDELFKYACDIM
jgi:hypothetical protein